MTGHTTADVYAMSGREFRALELEAQAAAWTDAHEMAALQTEILHGIFRMLVGAFTKSTPPDALRLPRPNDPKPQRLVVSAGDFARMIRRGGARRGD